jgi:23S rRNA pseudouridine1911/1915/1917 synthase
VSDRQVIFHYTEEEPQRLDKFLVNCLPEYSRSRLQALIKEERVTINGRPARKTGHKLEGGEIVHVHVPPPEETDLVPEAIPLDVIFENQDLLVVNKPAGMVVHPAAGHQSGTLVHAVLAHSPDIEGVGGEKRPGVVHRLDKNTSGLILLAKNDTAHRWLQNQFRARRVEKTYLALVDGAPPTSRGRIEAAIGRDTQQRKTMTVLPIGKGRQATTEYFTEQAFPQHTLLEVHPVTGRTHQIRVHLSFLGCPVVGDTVYGRHQPSLPLRRQFLHAARLVIRLPGESRPTRFEAPLPEELEQVLDQLRRGV